MLRPLGARWYPFARGRDGVAMRLRLIVLLRREESAVEGVDGVFLEDMLDSWMCVDV
jgi:hypothetical protein